MKNLGVEAGKKKRLHQLVSIISFIFFAFFFVVINGGSKQPHVKML